MLREMLGMGNICLGFDGITYKLSSCIGCYLIFTSLAVADNYVRVGLCLGCSNQWDATSRCGGDLCNLTPGLSYLVYLRRRNILPG